MPKYPWNVRRPLKPQTCILIVQHCAEKDLGLEMPWLAKWKKTQAKLRQKICDILVLCKVQTQSVFYKKKNSVTTCNYNTLQCTGIALSPKKMHSIHPGKIYLTFFFTMKLLSSLLAARKTICNHSINYIFYNLVVYCILLYLSFLCYITASMLVHVHKIFLIKVFLEAIFVKFINLIKLVSLIGWFGNTDGSRIF